MAEKSLLQMARALRRAKLPVKRPSTAAAQPVKEVQEEPAPTIPNQLYGQPLDSWEPRYRPIDDIAVRSTVKNIESSPSSRHGGHSPDVDQNPKKVPETLSEDLTGEGFVKTTRTAQRMVKQKARITSLSIAVSDEEAKLLRQYASSMDTSFSLWARSVLFRAMGRKPPARPKRS